MFTVNPRLRSNVTLLVRSRMSLGAVALQVVECLLLANSRSPRSRYCRNAAVIQQKSYQKKVRPVLREAIIDR